MTTKRFHLTRFLPAALVVVAVGCAKMEAPAPSRGTALPSNEPTEDSLLQAFAADLIPKDALVASAPAPAGMVVAAPHAWTWRGEVEMREGMSPFTTTVAVTSVRVEKPEGPKVGRKSIEHELADEEWEGVERTQTGEREASTYEGLVAWRCDGAGPYRCFENRFSNAETRYEYGAESHRWHKVGTRQAAPTPNRP